MVMVLFLTLELIDDSQIIQTGAVWRRKFQERNNLNFMCLLNPQLEI